MNYELCINDNVKDFIKKHLNDDVNKLALSKFPEDIDKHFVVRQIHARQVLSKKLPSWAENDELIFPKKLSLEQCSSELTAKYKTSLSTKSHEITRKGFSEDSCDLADEEKSANPHEMTREGISEDSCDLADEEKSANPHEMTLKGFSEDSCDLADEKISAKLQEMPRKEFSEDSCDLVDEKEISADSCELADKKRILVDLTGGMGVDTAFLSDNFDKTFYVEMQEELCEIARHNFKILNKNIEVINDNAEHFLTTCDEVDCIYLDPARRDEYGRKMVSLHDCSPDVAELHDILLKKAKKVLVKVSPMLDIEMIKKELTDITDIHVVAVRNECKEILLEIQKFRNSKTQQLSNSVTQKLSNSATQQLRILAIDLRENWNFSFTEDEECDAQWTLADSVGKYLYEPGAACMKAGCFKLLSQKYNLDKLHRNSHLYTSNGLISDFPGRIFEVLCALPFDKKTKKEITSICQQTTDNRQQTLSEDFPATQQLSNIATPKKASVATRNFPLSADELRKNLGLQDGNDFYIFGTTMKGEKKIVVIAKKL